MLCGYSLGGRLALRAAVRAPGRYRGVITIGASAGIEEPVARAQRAEADERLAGWMETMPIEEIVTVWERQPLFADQSDALVDEQRPGRLSHDPHALALLLRTAGQGVLDPGVARAGAAGAAAPGGGRRARRALRPAPRSGWRAWRPRAGQPWWRTPAMQPTCSSPRWWPALIAEFADALD